MKSAVAVIHKVRKKIVESEGPRQKIENEEKVRRNLPLQH
jgi:hypothetical protein